MSNPESNKVIYAAITANLAIAVTKFTAAGFTGSSAMISEGIHSLVDTGDAGLLLLGEHRSQKPADDEHPFGYGKELYFWTLIVAILIFSLGGGMSFYEGLHHLFHPTPIENPVWNYAVLAIAALFESYSFSIAVKRFVAVKGEKRVWEAIHRSKDPTDFVILFEDSAALLGLAVAFLGIFLGQVFGNPYFDGVASILIGVILGTVAVLLARETKGLLIGEGADQETSKDIRRLAQSDPAVENVKRALTMHFGPDTILLAMDLQFRKELSAAEVNNSIDQLERRIRHGHAKITHIFIESESLSSENQNAKEKNHESP